MCGWNSYPRPGNWPAFLAWAASIYSQTRPLVPEGQSLWGVPWRAQTLSYVTFCRFCPQDLLPCLRTLPGSTWWCLCRLLFLGFLWAGCSAFSSSSLVCPWSPRLSGRALLLFTAVTVVASPALQVSLGLIPPWLSSTLLSVTHPLRAVAACQVCWPGPAVVRDCACNRQLWSQTAGVRSPAPILTAPLCVHGIVNSFSLTQFPHLYNKDTNVHSLQASRVVQW